MNRHCSKSKIHYPFFFSLISNVSWRLLRHSIWACWRSYVCCFKSLFNNAPNEIPGPLILFQYKSSVSAYQKRASGIEKDILSLCQWVTGFQKISCGREDSVFISITLKQYRLPIACLPRRACVPRCIFIYVRVALYYIWNKCTDKGRRKHAVINRFFRVTGVCYILLPFYWIFR